MGMSIYNIKRWFRMLSGKSIYHVDQSLGQVIEQGGYYNDLTQKVVMGDSNLDEEGIPFLEHSNGAHVRMPTMIFQYGLGAYDLWLIEKKDIYREKGLTLYKRREPNGELCSNCYYLYDELYRDCDGYEVHMLMLSSGELKYLTVRCKDIIVFENVTP